MLADKSERHYLINCPLRSLYQTGRSTACRRRAGQLLTSPVSGQVRRRARAAFDPPATGCEGDTRCDRVPNRRAPHLQPPRRWRREIPAGPEGVQANELAAAVRSGDRAQGAINVWSIRKLKSGGIDLSSTLLCQSWNPRAAAMLSRRGS